jgi:cytochrome c-type protein NapB
MKKILATTVIGLLSLLIQLNAHAEKIVPDAKDTKSVESTQASSDKTAIQTESTISSDTKNTADNVTDITNTTEVTPKETKVSEQEQPAILGKSVNVHSLRGANKVASESEEFPNRRIMVVDGGIDVTFGDQPPMVPHNIDKDRISLQENTCLKCHSKVDSKLENAPKPTPSHFRGRDGKKQKTIVAGRYFCTQCHTHQANTKPLVKNTFTD